jgi:predicted DNA-binding antitoxin AbrB/MazE fold protein
VQNPDTLRHVDTSAIYEDGVLKLDPPLALKNGERISMTLHIAPEQVDRARLFAPRPSTGIDPTILEKIAMDAELGVDE